MTILLFGKNGQVGTELQRSLLPHGKIVVLGQSEVDVTKPDAIAAAIRAAQPRVIVNAAAYTAVDKAESERDLTFQINAIAPRIMADEAKRYGAKLIHYSTDYVFDGVGSVPYRESDAAHPLSVYGASKKAGEDAVMGAGGDHLIFRTSWVYGTAGNNFAKTIIHLAQTRETLSIVDDQIGAPTGAAFLADCTAQILKNAPQVNGLFHLTAAGETSWYGYARFVLETVQKFGITLKVVPEAIKPIPTHDYPTPARRPLNSRLNCTQFQETFGISVPQWQNGVTEMLNQLYGKHNAA